MFGGGCIALHCREFYIHKLILESISILMIPSCRYLVLQRDFIVQAKQYILTVAVYLQDETTNTATRQM